MNTIESRQGSVEKLDPLQYATTFVERAIRWMSPVLVLGACVNLARQHAHGGLWASCAQIACLIPFLATAFVGRRLPPGVRLCVYCGCCLAYGTIGLIRWGLIGQGLPIMILSVIFAAALGLRRWIIMITILLAALFVVAAGYVTGRIAVDFDPIAFMRSPAAWATAGFTVAVAGFAVLMWEQMFRELLRKSRLLAENETRLRLALSGAELGTWDWNVPTGTVMFDARWAAMLGYRLQEVEPHVGFWERAVHPDDLADVMAAVGAHLRGETPTYESEHRVRHKSGNWIWVLDKGTVIDRDAGGSPLRMCGTHLDITDRKKIEDVLRQSEQRFRTVLESLESVAVQAYEPDGRITFWNKASERLYGVSAADMLGKNLLDVLHGPATREEERRIMDQALGTGSLPAASEVELVRNDGAKVTILANRVLHPHPGKEPEFFCFDVDVTERKRQEEQLRQKSEELQRFTYAVSHDLKSPLVTIQAFLGLLKKDMETGDRGRIRKDMEFIRNAAGTMGTLLAELLEFSRIGWKVNPPESVLLQDLVTEALDLVAGRITQAHVEVAVTEDPIVLTGDRPRLREVFQNLIDNAVKCMATQPSPRLEIGCESREHETVFFVRDNGIGIDPRHKHRLFALFEKLHADVEGTGMGLAMVKRIVELHGGKIWAESAGVGQGATFYFTLAHVNRLDVVGQA